MKAFLAILALIAPAVPLIIPEAGLQDDGSYRVVDSQSYLEMCETMTSTELDEYVCKRDNPYA